ncbi:MAG: mismatch-specific DNA-glycosylase [Acidimicrobiales bacterium]
MTLDRETMELYEAGPPVVALDAAAAMLRLVPGHAPGAIRVRGDLAALPFRTGAGGAAWAAKTYVHVPRTVFPMALWDLHRVLAVGAPIELVVFEGKGEERWADDDLAVVAGGTKHRLFSAWTEAELADVAHGAGFDELHITRDPPTLTLSGARARTLADTVGPGLRLLLVGLNPSLYSADAGFAFARPGNRFWPALAAAGIHDGPRNPARLARPGGIGFTDLVKRATRQAGELSATELADGLARIDRLAQWLEPAAVCFLGLSGWRAAVDRRAIAGWQDRPVGGRPAYVMPNPSGLNAHATVASLAEHLRTAWAGPSPGSSDAG